MERTLDSIAGIRSLSTHPGTLSPILAAKALQLRMPYDYLTVPESYWPRKSQMLWDSDVVDSLRTDGGDFPASMKVAILTRDYPPAIGGIATHVEGLVKALGRLAVDADVFVGSNDI